ncbi:MAG: hypothetical protein ABIT20_24825 [Gemmatimonadaceae bacterium]
MQPNTRTILLTLGTMAALTACAADSTAPGAAGRQSMTVSFTTAASSGVAASRIDVGGLSRSLADTVGGNTLVISKVELVLARVELVRAGATCTSTEAAGDDVRGDDHDCAELELAPSLVNLPVTSAVATALSVTIPVGTYSSLEAKVRPVDANSGHQGAGTAAFLTAHPDLAGVSVRVQGTYNGKAFTYTAAPRAELEIAFNPALVVADSAANITVNIDVAKWFKTNSGALIDPSTALDGRSNANVVAQNIRDSFHAFKDDDRDGHDDHGQHGAGHP